MNPQAVRNKVACRSSRPGSFQLPRSQWGAMIDQSFMTDISSDQQAQIPPGHRFVARFRWRLEDDSRIWGGFEANVLRHEIAKDRLLARLEKLVSLRTSLPPAEMDQALLARARELVGRYCYLPLPALDEIHLPMRLTTLTGEHRYFFEGDAEGNELPERPSPLLDPEVKEQMMQQQSDASSDEIDQSS